MILIIYIFTNMEISTDFILSSKNLFDFYNNIRDSKIKFNDLLINIKKDKSYTEKINKILTLFNINIILFNDILIIISSKYNGNDRIFTYCFEYNLILILLVKTNLCNWSSLQSLIVCHNNHKSVYNQFRRWSKNDVFLKAYNNYILKNIKFINNNADDVLIDATCISNKYGSEHVTCNPEYKKKILQNYQL